MQRSTPQVPLNVIAPLFAGLTLLHLLMLSIVMIAGFTQANPANLRPFFSGERC